MPTTEEICAILALAQKAHNKYGALYDTERQYQIVMNFGKKWFEQREKNKNKARDYMRKRRETDKDYGH